jgi:O-antigen polymerase
LATLCGIKLWHLKNLTLAYPLPIILFISYVIWYIAQGNFAIHNALNNLHWFLIGNLLILLVYWILPFLGNFKLLHLSRVTTLLVVLEAFVCYFQNFGWVKADTNSFNASGTLVNPNLTAMFIVMAAPLVIYNIKSDESKFKFISQGTCFLIITTLLILQCRTAIIGGIIVTLYFLNYQNKLGLQLLSKFRKTNKIKMVILFVLLVLASILLLALLYYFKQGSSEGRLMIWRVATETGCKKIISGHGIQMFEKVYNLAQAIFFEDGQADKKEIFAASYIKIAYNDYLQNFVEGGLVGLLIYAGFIISLLASHWLNASKTSEFHAAYSGVLIFSIMSFFNSVEYAIPVFALFMVYAGILVRCTSLSANFRWYKQPLLIKKTKVVALTLFSFGIILLYSQVKIGSASRTVKIAYDLSKEGKNNETIRLLKPLENTLRFSGTYWCVYGIALHKMRKYESALDKFENGIKFTSDPEIYIKMSNCHMNLKNYSEAIKTCSTAINIVPNRIYPRYALMKIYENKQDTLNAIKIAWEIIAQQPKGTSKNADSYKKEARELIDILQ